MSDTSCFALPEEFCCCFSLTSGGKLVAGLCSILALIASILLTIYLFSDISEIAKEIATDDKNAEILVEDGSTLAKICAGVVLFLSVLLFISSIMLFKGINSKTQKQFLPFMYTLGVTIVFLLIISIIQFEAGGLFAVLTLIVVLIYLLIIVYALYKRLEGPRCREQTDIHLNDHYSP